MQPAVAFRLGGHVALDFVNTVDAWSRPATRDDLATFERLAAWTAQVRLLTEAEAERLAALPAPATDNAHVEALGLRVLLLRLLGAVIDGRPTASEDVDALNALLAEARAGQRLADRGEEGRFGWRWAAPVGPRTPAMLVALEAAGLLEGDDLPRLKRCPGPEGCGWLFLDESRNRSRRWCSMQFCGGHAKARRFARAHRHAH